MSPVDSTGRPPTLDRLLEHGLGLVLAHGLDGTIQWVSPELARLLEYDPSELVGGTMVDVFAEPGEIGHYLDDLTGDGVAERRAAARTKRGETRELRLTGSVIDGDEGGQLRAISRAEDVTALARAERELDSTLLHLDRVLGASPALVHRMGLGPGYGMTYLSPNATELTGYTAEELGRDGFWVERVHPDDRSTLLEGLDRLATSGSLEQEFRLLHADGSYRWMRATARLVRDDSGGPQEISGQWDDLSESRRLSEEVDRFFKVSLDLLCIRGVDGYFKRINPAFVDVLGHPRSELMSQPIQSFLHPDDIESTTRSLASATSSSETVTFEDRWRCVDGSYRWLEWRAIPYPSEGLIYAVARDVTEDRRHEADLRRAKRAADEANRAKSEFLANMSHEIRTPMNGVIGMTELALETNLTDQQREYLQMVQNSAGALLEVINSILDFSKIEAGKMELETIDFTLWETVTGALKPLAIMARNKRVELLYDEVVGVPERIRGDPSRLRQALINLAGNAVKFTNQGSVRITVSRVETAEPGVRLRFEVADTGIGIPAEKLDDIFESFQQVDGSMSRRFGGTGLGLAITSGLVELMDGRLVAQSEPGEGSTFSFTALFEEAAEPKLATRPGGSLEGLRALTVDDHESNLVILSDFAKRMGMVVTEAASGSDALRALDTAYRAGEPIQIALLDCHMPEMDGFELAERIRDDVRYKDLVMVAITAAGRPGDGARCQRLGIASYLLKPLAPWELRDALLLSLEKGSADVDRPELVTRHSLREARQTLHVLVAEDNQVNQQLAIHMLVRFGHTVRLARTGHEVLQAYDSEPFDVILMDIQMPEMDGVEATTEIRRREAEEGAGRHIPIIAMTAHAMVGDRERFLAAGMDDYISKPLSKDRLREVLRSVDRQAREDKGADVVAEDAPPIVDATTGAPAIGTRAYDRELLMERMESDVELIGTLVTVFESEYPELFTEMEAALAEDDGRRLERAAHTLKGALAVFGAEHARERSELLERLGRAGSVAEARGEYGPLRDAVEELTAALHELLTELGATTDP